MAALGASAARLVALSAVLGGFGLLVAGYGSAQSFPGGVRLPAFSGLEAVWSPDSRWIAVPNRGGIGLRAVDSGERRQIVAPRPRGAFPPPGPLSWSADGAWLRYVPSSDPIKEGDSRLIEVGRGGKGLRQRTLGQRALQAAWAPQGWPLAFTTGTYAYSFEKGPLGPDPALWVVPSAKAEPRQILELAGGTRREPPSVFRLALAPDGKRILYVENDRRWMTVHTVALDGSDRRRIGPKLVWGDPAWSPDGREIALTATLAGSDVGQRLYVMPADGGPLRLISAESILGPPAWTPDGRWITFATYEGEIKRVRPDGSDVETVASLPGEEILGLLWSPDGHRLAFSARPTPPSD